MAKYIIDTDTMSIVPYVDTPSQAIGITLADLMADHRGETEYNGIVKTIQEWYYGSLVKASWCATAVSYFADQLGILSQLGGKNENVKKMMDACKIHQTRTHEGQFFTKVNIPSRILKGDILFWLWEGNIMTSTSSKHVGVAEYNSTGQTIFCIGGNQKDKICTLEYDRKYLYAVYRPDYN